MGCEEPGSLRPPLLSRLIGTAREISDCNNKRDVIKLGLISGESMDPG
jgi:hypothetical protein